MGAEYTDHGSTHDVVNPRADAVAYPRANAVTNTRPNSITNSCSYDDAEFTTLGVRAIILHAFPSVAIDSPDPYAFTRTFYGVPHNLTKQVRGFGYCYG